ncbi:hypothetical protein EC973_002293 [Apophysomyces ossiformis]|uniref:Uncharacterized protein n=1 Tax=Apophysomyces ossiformis TaxID=679940 RepID=A0A8H7BKU1_9FUNG|nr:hypothetical protein EC973_002293 [Apophysomyces ossiformis]
MKSIPLPDTKYSNLSIGTYEESDGNSARRKLKVDPKTMNVLITMSLLMSSAEVFLGPETPVTFGKSQIRIFYDQTKNENFLAIIKQQFKKDEPDYKCPTSISSLRQLQSGFGNRSTFSPRRATLGGFGIDVLQPATIFTIADIPSNQGYGVSDKSSSKTASCALQAAAIAVLNRCQLSSQDIKDKLSHDTSTESVLANLMSHLNCHGMSILVVLPRF